MKTNKSAETIIVLMLACIIAFLVFYHNYFLWIAAILGSGAIVSTRFASIVHAAWFKLGKAIGFVTGKIILTTIYLLVVVPVALVFRKKLSITLKKQSGSYFVERNHLYLKEDIENPW